MILSHVMNYYSNISFIELVSSVVFTDTQSVTELDVLKLVLVAVFD